MIESEQVELLKNRMNTLVTHFCLIRNEVGYWMQENPELFTEVEKKLTIEPTYSDLEKYSGPVEKLKYQIKTLSDQYVKLMDIRAAHKNSLKKE